MFLKTQCLRTIWTVETSQILTSPWYFCYLLYLESEHSKYHVKLNALFVAFFSLSLKNMRTLCQDFNLPSFVSRSLFQTWPTTVKCQQLLFFFFFYSLYGLRWELIDLDYIQNKNMFFHGVWGEMNRKGTEVSSGTVCRSESVRQERGSWVLSVTSCRGSRSSGSVCWLERSSERLFGPIAGDVRWPLCRWPSARRGMGTLVVVLRKRLWCGPSGMVGASGVTAEIGGQSVSLSLALPSNDQFLAGFLEVPLGKRENPVSPHLVWLKCFYSYFRY